MFDKHILIYNTGIKNQCLFVNRKEFKYIIEFTDVFYDLFWNKKLLPESLKRIDEELKNTPFDWTYYDRMYKDYDVNDLLNDD